MAEAPRAHEPVVEAVRRALIEAAIHAYDDAGLSGLCADGRWELAVDSMRRLDLQPAVTAVMTTMQPRV